MLESGPGDLGQEKYTLGRPGEVRLLVEIGSTSSSGMS
jgi:hypothetical protein